MITDVIAMVDPIFYSYLLKVIKQLTVRLIILPV
jgi:hypothetical protein